MFTWLQDLIPRTRPRPTEDVRIDRVAPWLLIGPQLPPHAYAELVERGVTHVVDLRAESDADGDAFLALGLGWRRVPVADRTAPTDDQFDEIVRWLEAEADPDVDQAVYVHCHAGLGRTPSVAMALLMEHGLSLAEAQRQVLTARPEASPTAEQLEWLIAREARRQPGR